MQYGTHAIGNREGKILRKSQSKSTAGIFSSRKILKFRSVGYKIEPFSRDSLKPSTKIRYLL